MKIKRIVAIVMTVAFMLCCAAMPVAAEEAAFTDLEGSEWAAGSIERWADAKVLDGYGDGTFHPTKFMTRGEFAKVIAVTLGLDDKLPADTFKDLDADEWYTPYVLLCAEAKIMQGHGDGIVDAESYITREQAFAMIVRAFKLAPVTDEKAQAEVLKGFADKDEISDWALSEVAAIVASGAVVGEVYGDDMLIKSQDNIKRQELVKILDRLIIAYVDENGKVSVSSEIGDADAAKYGKTGNIVVVNQNCTKDVVITTGVDVDGTPVVNVSVEGLGDASNIPVKNGETPVVVVEKESAIVNEKIIVDDRDDDEKAAFHQHEFEAVECKEPCEVAHTEYEKCECGETKEIAVPAKAHDFVNGKCKVCGKTTDDALKFALKVESGAKVTATVTDDYNAVIFVENGKVSAKEVTLTATMKDVGSLGLGEDEVRSHSITVNTDMTAENVDLTTWLSNAWGKDGKGFKATTVAVDICDKECTYVFKGSKDANGNAVIEATTDVTEARAAWAELTSHVESKSVDTTAADYVKDDSKVVINNESYVVIGGEKLRFEAGKDHLVLDNFNELDTLKQNIKDHVEVVAVDNKDVVAFVGAGTELRVGDSVATLKDDCTIKVTGLAEKDLEGILSEIRTEANGSTTALVKALVTMINDAIGSMEGESVKVEIDFAE